MRLLQIYEEDLAELEHIIPQWTLTLSATNSPTIRTQLRRVREILANVRWGYGPFTDVEVTPTDEPLA